MDISKRASSSPVIAPSKSSTAREASDELILLSGRDLLTLLKPKAVVEGTIQYPSSDESLEVITTLAPVETRLAENPPSPRPQISAERGKETPA